MARSTLDTRSIAERRTWWKEAVVYQIYPRSFNDSNGDGVGDIPGIIEKVDYLDELGVDVVWLNPVYESPNADNGYDIADYRSVMDEFGTMRDWENLLAALHDRGIKLIMDLVVNHTSDEHEWFEQSRQSTDNPYRDYYYWREGRDAADAEYDCERGPEGEVPPNNWDSFFGGPAWSYDEQTEQWYLHLFDEKQPDLNWRNPEVRQEIHDMMEWWLEKGIDGFRMDVINLISKTEGLPDGDPNGGLTGMEHFSFGPELKTYLDDLHDDVLSNYDVMTVGEMPGASVEEGRRYTGEDGPLDMIFHFEHMGIDYGEGGKWDVTDWALTDLKAIVAEWQHGLADEGWNSIYLNNHDQPRLVSRFGDDEEYHRESATMLATFTHTLRATPYVYQGEEIGMTNYPFEDADELRDVEAINFVEECLANGAEDFEDVKNAVRASSRDNARTPIQWQGDAPNAGFTDGEPWINVNPNYDEINVADAREDADSIFRYYADLIDLREEYDVLVYGDYAPILEDDESVFAYRRRLGHEEFLVVLNFADIEVSARLPDSLIGRTGRLMLGNYLDRDRTTLDELDLQPYEARVYRVG